MDQLQTVAQQPVAVWSTQVSSQLLPSPPCLLAGTAFILAVQPGTRTWQRSWAALQPSRQRPPASPSPAGKVFCNPHCFLGYLATALRVPAPLSLALLVRPGLVAHFPRAKMQADQDQQTVLKAMQHLAKV